MIHGVKLGHIQCAFQWTWCAVTSSGKLVIDVQEQLKSFML